MRNAPKITAVTGVVTAVISRHLTRADTFDVEKALLHYPAVSMIISERYIYLLGRHRRQPVALSRAPGATFIRKGVAYANFSSCRRSHLYR